MLALSGNLYLVATYLCIGLSFRRSCVWSDDLEPLKTICIKEQRCYS